MGDQEDHPGGKKVLLKACGTDSSEKFWQFHSKKVLEKTAKPMMIGTGESATSLVHRAVANFPSVFPAGTRADRSVLSSRRVGQFVGEEGAHLLYFGLSSAPL